MKIWWVNHYAVPPDQPGGTRHFTFARELMRRGHAVTLIASSVDYVTRSESRLMAGQRAGREVVDGVPFLWVRTPAYGGASLARLMNMWAFTWGVWKRAPAILDDSPDVVIGSTPHPFAALAAERVATRLGVPFVLEVRDLWPKSLVDLGNVSPFHPLILLLDRLERYLCRRAAMILCLLPAARAHLVERGAEASSVVTLPNGIDLRLVPHPVEPPEAEPFTVMYAGAHGLANGLDTVLDAARRLSDGVAAPRFVFVGEGPLRDGLMQRAKREGIANVEFRPPVPKNCVHRTLADAHAFVLPLKRGKVFEHGISPNKLFDYMAAARPVILSVDTPNNPVAEARAGETVAPEDAEGLAAAVNRLQSMPASERRAMGARAREYVVAHHDLAALAPRLEAALSAVCGSCARQGGQALL